MTSLRMQIAINDAVANAQHMQGLVERLRAVDPALAQAIEGKALIASKTPWGTAVATLAAYISSKYALGWDESTDELVALGGMLVGSYIMRMISPARITGIVTPTPLPARIVTPGAP